MLQFVRFAIVGIFNTAIDYAVYLVLTRILGVYFLIANFVAVVVAMTFSFFVNKKWTFKNTSANIKSQYLKFAVINLGALILNNFFVYIFVNYAHLYDLLAKFIVIVITLNWNFWLNKYWTFKADSAKIEIS